MRKKYDTNVRHALQVHMINDTPTLTFAKSSYRLESEEAERVSVDQVSHPRSTSIYVCVCVCVSVCVCVCLYVLHTHTRTHNTYTHTPHCITGLASAACWGFLSIVVHVDAHGVRALSSKDAPEKVPPFFQPT